MALDAAQGIQMLDRSGIRLLLLDDDPFMTKVLGRMLGGLGFAQVHACDNGHDALLRVDQQAPDLILCDLNMPEMDGLEFVRHLVERQFAGSLVLVSGENERILQTAEKTSYSALASNADVGSSNINSCTSFMYALARAIFRH